MQTLRIAKTGATLEVDFNPLGGTMSLTGESYPENALAFFAPVLDWAEHYCETLGSGSRLQVEMDIVYFNSSSSKALMRLFEILDAAAWAGADVHIVWRYHEENEMAQECGEEFAEELGAARFVMEPYGDPA